MHSSSEHICVVCRQIFTSQKRLLEHTGKEHSVPVKHQNRFYCNDCSKEFRDSYNLKRHIAFIHSPKSDSKAQNNTKCVLCSKLCLKKDIIKHFSSAHQVCIEEESLEFQTNDLFEGWKMEMENDTKSRYVKVRNLYRYKDGSTLNTYYCHRDGFAKNSKGKNVRRMKVFGSNKINGHCPSKLVVKCNAEGQVSVRFTKTHVGHATELNRIYLTKKEKEVLAQKLALNVPFDQILDDIRDSMRDSDLQRLHLLSKQDLRNIARDFKVNKNKSITLEEFTGESWLNAASVHNSNFIRLYKQKGSVSNEFPQLKPKDFLLLIMNDMQKEMLSKYGNNYVCIDLTHGIYLHDLDMYTVFVIDESQKAFPCALGFSNRADLIAMELMLFGIQDSLKKVLYPKLLMSNEMLHDAWCAVMTAPASHIYNSWQVDLEWRGSLKKIPDKEKQTVIYKKLRQLLEEKDMNSFEVNLENLQCLLENDSDSKDFLICLKKYKNVCNKWASCHQKHLRDSLFEAERLHKSLKYIYLKRKKSQNLDETICNIMSYLRGMYLSHSIITVFDKLTEVKIGHKTAINMTQANLTKINNMSWDVSDPTNEEVFHVERVMTECINCPLYCLPCSACLHLYACSCHESVIKWNMCQHIHLVCIVAKHEQSIEYHSLEEKSVKISECNPVADCDLSNVSFTGNDSDSEHLSIIHHISTPVKSDSEVEMKKKEILSKFTGLLDSATSLEQLDLINKHLTPCGQEFGVVFQNSYEESSPI